MYFRNRKIQAIATKRSLIYHKYPKNKLYDISNTNEYISTNTSPIRNEIAMLLNRCFKKEESPSLVGLWIYLSIERIRKNPDKTKKNSTAK